jgi:hypothetical protein
MRVAGYLKQQRFEIFKLKKHASPGFGEPSSEPEMTYCGEMAVSRFPVMSVWNLSYTIVLPK